MRTIFYNLILIALLIFVLQGTSHAAENRPSENEMALDADEIRTGSARQVRRFHEVLDELLAEFGYDVKQGQLKGLKNLAIRQVHVSNALPKTYRDYSKTLVAERIRENSQVRLINCIQCQSKQSKFVDGKLMITSPATNPLKLKMVAEQLGIDNFMDVILVYHTTHMVLAFQIFKVDSNELTWSRTYNSETIKSRYQKLAIDYSQVAKSRPGEDYVPEYRILAGIGGGGIPNVGGDASDSSMLQLYVRATEKFNNRSSEFGMLLSFYKTFNSIMDEYPKVTGTGSTTTTIEAEVIATDQPATPEAFENALGLYAVYGHNFLGAVESYNRVRQGILLGAGGLMTSGYFAPSLKVGWDMYFGRRWGVNSSLVLIGPSKILIDNETLDTKGGFGADVAVSFNY